MNVLIIPTWYPNGKDMLMGVYHKEFCEALVKEKNLKVNMLFIERERLNNPIKYLFMKKDYIIEENGYKTYVKRMLNVERINFDFQMRQYVKTLEKAFKEYLKKNPKPDILHAEVTIPAGYATCILGKKYNIPVVVTEHATYYKDFFRGQNKKYTEFVLKNAYYTSVSKYMLEDLPDYVTKKKVIPNLVDTESFKLNRKKIKGLRIAKVCAFRKGKRIEDLLSALRILIDKYKIEDVLLTIVGDGYLKSFYEEKCHELNLEDYVKFVGRKSKEEIAQILNENNMFVITSTNETFCIPGIEALASGMPVVSTKCFGPEEYIDEKSGKLVEIGNIEEIASAIASVYQNIEEYDIKYLRDIADRYSAKNVTDMALEVYQELIRKDK
ncbi:glycosyl transferase group 1 [Mycoplasma sp. CAG:776]|nr:glycosyl transferase group 1 [Mycoplasma sp. CAG:776]